LGELTDETNAHKAFSKFGIAYGLAVIIGPSLGGLLAEPARWSSFDTAFWNDYPYLLPVIVLVSMSVLTFGYTLVFLPETETWLKNQKELASGQVLVTGNTEDVELLAADTLATTEEEKFQRLVGVADDSTCSKLIPAPARERNVILAIALVSLNAVIYMSYDVMFSVFLEAPEVDGGLGLSTEITGYFTSVYGLTMVIYQAKFYRTLAAKWGTRNCIIKGFQGFMVLFALFPFLSYINTAYDDWMLYIFITMFQVARGLAGSTATMSAQVLITQVTHSSVLGQVNGVANSFTALGKLTGPFFIGGIWTTCLGAFESRYPRVSVTYWVLVVVALIGVIVAKKVPKVYKVKTNL
jgi:MFS family permease